MKNDKEQNNTYIETLEFYIELLEKNRLLEVDIQILDHLISVKESYLINLDELTELELMLANLNYMITSKKNTITNIEENINRLESMLSDKTKQESQQMQEEQDLKYNKHINTEGD